MDLHAAATTVITRHHRRPYSHLCTCSPIAHHRRAEAIVWSPEHVIDALAAAGVLSTERIPS